MTNTYSTISGLALALLFSAGVSAQTFNTAAGASREAAYAIKKHEAGAHSMAPRVLLQDGELGAAAFRGGIPNDLCIDAIALTMNAPGDCPGTSIPGSNAGAGDETGDPSCDVTTVGYEDVWYTFNSGAVTSATIEITVGDIADLITEVFELGCGGASVFCNVSGLINTFAVIPGTDYAVRIVSNNQYGVGGTFDICLSGIVGGSGPANDDCAGAIDMTVGADCVDSPFTMLDASQTLPPSLCSTYTSSAANDVWFSFTATSAVTIVRATGGGDATTGVDAVLEAYSGDCATLVSLGCIDATVRGEAEQLTLSTMPGTTYYYRVYYWIYTAGTPVLDFTTCVYTPGGIPTNDECGGAVVQDLVAGGSVVFSGDNTGALDTEGLGFGSVWESFTTTECTFVTLDYCGSTPAFGNVFILLASDCPPTNMIYSAVFNDTDCGDGNWTVNFDYLPAGTYYYPVLTDVGSEGPYTITVSAVACPPGYCAASADLCDEYISRVQFAEIDNTSDCADGPAVDYTAISGTVAQGASVPITVTNGPLQYASDQVAVWIDWNQNEVLTDVGEAYALTSADGAVSFTGNIDVPAGATLGSTRMRIRMMYTGTPAPCGTSAYGEVEDYTVNVEISIGVNEATQESWTVFPNPSNGDFTVQFGDLRSSLGIEVIDNTGRLVHAERIAAQHAGMKQVSLAGSLAAGVYVLRVTTDNGRDEQRIVIR